MMFPSRLDTEVQDLQIDSLSDNAKSCAETLRSKGYKVVHGITKEYASKVAELTKQPSIREYCPKDNSERFKDLESMEHWLEKGRAFYMLIWTDSEGNKEVAGYGWLGSRTNPHIPGGETTFSLRISELHQGKGLAAPFSVLILEAGKKTYSTPNLWLEAWKSNAGAVHIYHKLGFLDVAEEQEMRPTAKGGTISDTRMYMKYPEREN
ncbi:MAG: GNAT family N-acetyltransferase [Candidatus Saccharimonadales bacterium]